MTTEPSVSQSGAWTIEYAEREVRRARRDADVATTVAAWAAAKSREACALTTLRYLESVGAESEHTPRGLSGTSSPDAPL